MTTLKVPTETIDMETGQVLERRETEFTILAPVDKEACQICGRRHTADQPHDAQSLGYQYRFRAEHGRWPSWEDALAHCSPEVQAAWKNELIKRGAWGDEEPSPEERPQE